MATRFKIIPLWYWVVAVLAVLWELMGCAAFVMDVITYRSMYGGEIAQQLFDGVESNPSVQLQLYMNMPTWQWVVYGVAVFTGLFGAIALLTRSPNAVIWFDISIVAIVIQFGYTFLATPILRLMPPSQALPLPTAIFVIGLALIWFTSIPQRRGWFRKR